MMAYSSSGSRSRRPNPVSISWATKLSVSSRGSIPTVLAEPSFHDVTTLRTGFLELKLKLIFVTESFQVLPLYGHFPHLPANGRTHHTFWMTCLPSR